MTESAILDDACDRQTQPVVTVPLRERQKACSLQYEVEADL